MERVRIPASLNEPDIFLSIGPLKMSMRQLVTTFGCIFMWVGLSSYMLPSIGLGGFLAYAGTFWLPLAGVAFSFVKIRGRPLDMWLGLKFSFIFGPRTFILRRPRSDRAMSQSNLEITDDDLDAMIGGMGGAGRHV